MRTILTVCLAGLLAWQTGCQSTVQAAVRRDVNLAYVEGLAADLASRDYNADEGKVPDFLADLSYDDYRDIRFDGQRALWAEENLPFRIEFFHPGNLFQKTVRINEFTATHEQEIRFNSSFFNYGRNEDLSRRLDTSLGYAGFRVRYPINKREVYDEVAVFLGASYFRAVGRDQVYGLSARGLAIDTGIDQPEEFPRFREFWLGKPETDASELRFYALLDSASATGAYEFILRPGEETELDVRATIYLRKPVARLGLTPFSSMFFFGENTLNKPEDYRPEVHDSDGVLMLNNEGGALWRPLVNPPDRRSSVFAAGTPAGFGLIQRDRDFEHYQDIEAAYHLRPSAWVTPREMPEGSVTLFEFHSPNETADNVALFYVPTTAPTPREPYRIAYTLSFGSQERSPAGVVTSTRSGRTLHDRDIYEFIVDFGGGRLAELPDVEKVTSDLSVNGGAELAADPIVLKNPFNNTWRMIVYVRPVGDAPAEFHGHLLLNEELLTEAWSFQWIRPPRRE